MKRSFIGNTITACGCENIPHQIKRHKNGRAIFIAAINCSNIACGNVARHNMPLRGIKILGKKEAAHLLRKCCSFAATIMAAPLLCLGGTDCMAALRPLNYDDNY